MTVIAGLAVVFCAYWNIAKAYQDAASLPPREKEEVVLKEQRIAPIRSSLASTGYKGEIAFVTNRAVHGLQPTPEDEKQWGQYQYSMLPWMLVRDRKDTPFVLGDFYDGMPNVPLEGVEKFSDAGNGLILFRRNQ